MEENFVVLADREIFVTIDLHADLDDATGDRGDFRVIGQYDTAFGGLFRFVLPDQNAISQGFDKFRQRYFLKCSIWMQF